ncbi:hypothetical protein [Halonotius sp. GCM10025705]|uniref:hypothetical protein n=1 Tax=Halonotius sp. GCM10025705 TaxID=3252678 RepID=UPI0036D3791B
MVRFPIGLAAAGIAVLGMNRLMAHTAEGTTPPSVAASVLTGRPVDAAPSRLASVVHYLAGLGTGLLFVYFLLVAEQLTGALSATTVAGTTVALYVLMVGFFILIPLPRATGLDDTRRSQTGLAWAIAAAGYLLVLVPATVGLSLVVA